MRKGSPNAKGLLSILMGSSLSTVVTKTSAGTPAYMAPEAEQGVLRRESDVFSLGVCLYEVVTGVLPFEGPIGTVILNKLAGKYEPPSRRAPGLGGPFDALMAKSLAPQPAARFATPAHLYAALDAFGRVDFRPRLCYALGGHAEAHSCRL